MKELSPLGIQCLKRVFRLFLRLYCSPAFSNIHQGTEGPGVYAHWYESKYERFPSKQLTDLLNKDIMEYCRDCQQRRSKWDWGKKLSSLTMDYLHCSGCNVDHPTCLFSKAQRLKLSKNRICIGREGFVRLCDHYVITWNEVINIALELRKLNTSSATVFLKDCKYISHAPQHMHSEIISGVNLEMLLPTVKVSGCRNENIKVDLEWLGYLDLSRTGFNEDGYNKIATPTLIRQELEKFRQGAAEYIAPEFSPGRLTEMNCFDPNRCSCLRYAGVEQLPHGWQLTPCQGIQVACREDPSNNILWPLRSFQDNNFPMGKGRIEAHDVAVYTTGLSPTSVVMIRMEPYCKESQHLRISYHRRATILPVGSCYDRVSWVWCQMLDPDSYSLTDDMETFGIFWCWQKGCRNYYKYLKKAPFPIAGTNRVCQKPCRSK